MLADLPHTLYKRRGKDGGKVNTQEEVDEATRLMQEAYERKQREEGYSINDIFAGKADMEKEENN